ncbi:MAG: phosphoribosylformylglycinamidine cyclo-ligase [Lysobacteraceae bacterium]|nr:MAG: phosphoribosylformylglycinamidine cyclo-ligase [Xanthomonadaceae bacterium]
MSNHSDKPTEAMTYKQAGVDIEAGNQFVDKIKPLVEATRRSGMMSGIGGFGGLFHLDPAKYRDPVLVSGTDGVGTKLKLAQILSRHDTIGIDLVGMCVNDVVVQGAEPLFFLDYFATGALQQQTAASVVAGIAEGCKQAGCALIGGETAEMPDMYPDGEYDLAGFCVGVVERDQLLDAANVQAGQVLIGIESSGPHSNGYTLIRRIIERNDADLDAQIGDRSLGDALIEPTRIYVKPMLGLVKQFDVAAMAHITGGGLTENIVRVIPEHLGIDIDLNAWTRPAVFNWLAEKGPVDEDEMLRAFNCGIGMVVVIDQAQANAAIDWLGNTHQLSAHVIGSVTDNTSKRVNYR